MRCVIISGSPQTNSDFLKQAIKNDDYVICADSGYGYSQLANIVPDLIVGDFDSFKGEIPDSVQTVRLKPEKDDTDTIHAITLGIQKGFRDFLLLGALGGRTDHTFANISALEYLSQHSCTGVILSENERIELLTAGEHIFKGQQGKTFSLFPFGCCEVCVSYEGAKYPLNKYKIKSSFPIGISNIFTSDFAKIKIYDGNAILIINANEDCIYR